MVMDSSDLFMLRRGLVDAGMKDEAAEKVAVAMEGAVALTIDQVLQKWTAELRHEIDGLRHEIDGLRKEVKHDVEIAKRDMTIRLGAMIFAAAGLSLGMARLMF